MTGGWKQFKKSKAAVCALLALGTFYTLALFADFFAPYHYDDDDVMYAWSPRTVHFINLEKKIFWPHTYPYTFTMNKYYHRVYECDRNDPVPLRFFIKGHPYKLLGLWETDIHLFGIERGRVYLLGADDRGRYCSSF